jgi:hypothetical protein
MLESAEAEAPPEQALYDAAALYEAASPAMIEGTARWLAIDERLRTAGVVDETLVRLYAELIEFGESPKTPLPAREVVWIAFERWPDLEFATQLCNRLRTKPLGLRGLRELATMAVAIRGRAGCAASEEDEPLISVYAPRPALLAALAAVAEARRDALCARLLGNPINENGARAQLQRVLPLLPSCQGPETRAALQPVLEMLRQGDAWRHLVSLAETGGGLAPRVRGLTRDAESALDYLLQAQGAKNRAATIGEVAEGIHSRGVVSVHEIAELAGFSGWLGATRERRESIAKSVSVALGPAFKLDGLKDFAAGPLALFTHVRSKLPFVLVPGGIVERGCSDEELAVVKAAAELAQGIANWEEEFGGWLHDPSSMRPVMEIPISPLLACRKSIPLLEPSRLPDWLERATPLRLPSEAEWEWLSRGGQRRQLTSFGNSAPTERDYLRMHRAGKKRMNPFGCWGFGMQPEVCADAYVPNYEGAPRDATPRWGDGPRVARGGAAMLYPWQAVGEWQLLCNAIRASSGPWEFEVSTRPVVGVIPV